MECCSKLERYSEGIEILKNGLKVGLKDEWGLGNKLKLELVWKIKQVDYSL